MVFAYLDKVRKKPLHARRRFAFIVATVITSLVIVVWVVSLPARFASLHTNGDTLSGSVGASEFGDALDKINENSGVQGVIDQGQDVQNLLVEEALRETAQQNAMGGMVGASSSGTGTGSGIIETTTSATTSNTSNTMTEKQKPVMIATTSSASTVH